MKKNFIVTGASGFVGRNLVEELTTQGHQVYAVVRGKNTTFPDGVKTIVCAQENIKTLPSLLPEGVNFSTCYHLAWAGSSKQEERIDYTLQLKQIQRTLQTMEVMKELNCPRMVVTGSIMEEEVMANLSTQGTKPSLAYVYGTAKLSAHAMAQSLATSLEMELLWCQITNTYGVGETSQRMVNSTLRKCSAGEPPQFTAGTQNYDFIYISDVVRALFLVGEKGKPFSTYLIGSGEAKPLKEFLLEMQKAVAPELAFHFGDVPFTGVNLDLQVFSTALLREDTGFQPEISFGEGCKKTKRWLEANDK